MNQPRRLLEETDSELERALLTAGRSYRSLPQTREQVLMAMGLVGSAAAASTVTTFAWARLAELGSAKLLVGFSAVVVMAAIPAGYVLWPRSEPKPAPAAAPSAIAAPAARAASVKSDEAAVVRQPELAPAPSALPAGKPASSPAPRSKSRSVTRKASLAAELSAVDAARAKLYGGNAPAALALLNAYARDYPRGRLSLEAEALRIDALAKSGNLALAKTRAEAFVRRHPRGVLAARVRRYLAD